MKTRVKSPNMTQGVFVRPTNLQQENPTVPKLQENPMWPNRWKKRRSISQSELILESMSSTMEQAMVALIEAEAERCET